MKKVSDIMSNIGKVEREWLFPISYNITIDGIKMKLSGVCSQQIKGVLHTACNEVLELTATGYYGSMKDS